ncbi:alpha/beta hydrolase [Polynucleobacter sp. MWH-Aus1W21]|uniref:alpha/beta hydrolase n=1 Tax=Polynucleobacter sp. MWH-Aus1W21 TaxID=1855880 RepID=UPI001BFE8C03|nr:alpha/beta hydrolase [Polynucleobacter sp. MWH-Aus1W21]QWD67095.1 alpha/beta hydrolase [Polynucleobacter sp. MWH-Aus1W21]
MNMIPLPAGIRSRVLKGINNGAFHILEAGAQSADSNNLVLLIHGFPELAYSWRKIMLPLAAEGYHVIAPDIRGYGRSSNTDVQYSDDLRPFSTLNKIQDMLALVASLGYRTVRAVIGHDQGATLAGWCALSRPDIFKSVALMSSPFRGAPAALPFNTTNVQAAPIKQSQITEELAMLSPPRKYYQHYFATEAANNDMWQAEQGLKKFLRAYYHMKSADWSENAPFKLKDLLASEWEKLPRYYVMDLDKGMAETVLPAMPSTQEIKSCQWLPDHELDFYISEYSRTGFQGGLQGYRNNPYDKDLAIFAGRKIEVPSTFIGGEKDWGIYQTPGGLETLENELCTHYQGTHLIKNAGHWVQQEQPEETSKLLIEFITKN